MKNKTNRSLLIGSILTVALAVAIGSPVLSQSARPAEGKAMMEGKMMEHCRALMAEKQKLLADMKAQDAELTKEVAQMNSAPVDKKMNLMAAVITRMVEQRTSMNLRMEKMQEAMMQHMMSTCRWARILCHSAR
jgi:hypothetical protein